MLGCCSQAASQSKGLLIPAFLQLEKKERTPWQPSPAATLLPGSEDGMGRQEATVGMLCVPHSSAHSRDALGMGMASPQLHGHGRFASAWMARNEIPGFPLGFGLLAGCCPGSRPDPSPGGCREQGGRMLLAWGCIFQLPAISLKTLISAVQTRWLKLCDFEGEKKRYFKQCLGQQIEKWGAWRKRCGK